MSRCTQVANGNPPVLVLGKCQLLEISNCKCESNTIDVGAHEQATRPFTQHANHLNQVQKDVLPLRRKRYHQ